MKTIRKYVKIPPGQNEDRPKNGTNNPYPVHVRVDKINTFTLLHINSIFSVTINLTYLPSYEPIKCTKEVVCQLRPCYMASNQQSSTSINNQKYLCSTVRLLEGMYFNHKNQNKEGKGNKMESIPEDSIILYMMYKTERSNLPR